MRKWYLACAALLLVVFAAGCGKTTEKKVESTAIPKDDIVSIYVESSIGDLTIEPGSGKSIQFEGKATVKAGSRDRRELIAANVLVTTDTTDPSVLAILSRLSDNVALKEEESYQIDLTVKVPTGIGSVIIQSGDGDILIQKMKSCEISVINNKGNIEVKDSSFIGKSNITNIVGDVKVKLKSITNTQEIQISADVGDITFNCPKRSSYTVTVVERAQQGSTWSNKTGKTIIGLTTKVGKIRFQQ